MFGSDVLDVAIGLIMVFLLVSLVLTAVQETIEAWLRSRSSDLNKAIYELLQQDPILLKKVYNHPLIFALHRATLDSDAPVNALQIPNGWMPFSSDWKTARAARADLPSYIPRETFVAALIDLFATGEVTEARLVQSYDALNRLSGGDLARIRVEIQNWYDGAMDRASGWFKRRTHKILFWLGFFCAIALNINAFTIGNYLATNKQAREYASSYAKQLADNRDPKASASDPAKIADLYAGLQNSVGLPIGWSQATVQRTLAGVQDPQANWFETIGVLVALLAGYLITGFAGTLGAPFWFDALNRVMVIRSTVKPKEKSPDEPSQDGGKDKSNPSGGAGPAGAGVGLEPDTAARSGADD